MPPTIVWFRQDLRLQDNPALIAALQKGGAVVPVFILDPAAEGRWPAGAASRWWLHHSLAALDASLRERDSRLVLAGGDTAAALRDIIGATGARAVYWNRRYEPACAARDARVEATLKEAGIEVRRFNASLLHEPEAVSNRQGGPFQVFTPFWRHCLGLEVEAPAKPLRGVIPAPRRWPRSLPLGRLGLLPRIRWDAGLAGTWTPGEAGAMERLCAFCAKEIGHYAEGRNLPAVAGTSMLSAHLHFGEVGPRQVWAAVREIGLERGVFPPHRGAAVFLAELGWREFAHHLLFHFPETPEKPLRAGFSGFPWARDPGRRKLEAWRRGRTGYPIVDAGMRQLWKTGWMHNRVRMIVASFLVKHLRLPWNEGAAWFWDTLVDADLASNTLGWQWSAGCGADAAPYFRIFAPVLQGRKFDPGGDYVRRWVPELTRMPREHIHAPWEADAATLQRAGVTLGKNYPRPIVDHATARAEALAAFRQMRGTLSADPARMK